MNIQLSKNLSKELVETSYVVTDEKKNIERLNSISDVNIFVGANNSGKSRFSRGLLKINGYTLFSDEFNESLKEAIDLIERIHQNILNGASISFHHHHTSKIEKLDVEMELINSNFNKNSSAMGTVNFNHNFLKSNLNILSTLLTEIDRANKEKLIKDIRHFDGVVRIVHGICSNFNSVYRVNNYKGLSINIRNFNISYCLNIKDDLESLSESVNSILKEFIQIIRPKKVFIPTQRGAKTLLSSDSTYAQSDLYKNTIIRTYFKEVDRVSNFQTKFENITIFTGLDLYDQVKKVRNSKRKVRKSFEKFEIFLKKNFFNNKEVDIVALDGDQHLSFYIDDDDREIHDLGDGIQALIVLMFPIFTAEKDSWIFIDEPELNLHPGMQRLFLKQILSNPEIKKKNLKFFITTHSNHLLDLTLNQESISIFSFSKLIGKTSKEHKFLIRNVKSGDTSLMEDLGVNNSSVFLANCSIWVEGITDRKYLSAFLTAYLKSLDKAYYFKEDADFTFFEYAGSNLAHYYFSDEVSNEQKEEIRDQINAFSLSNRIYLLADKDGDDKKSKHDFLKKVTKENNNIIYRDTGAIEIENILSFSILQKALVNVFGQDEIIINNIDNIYEKDYAQERLGHFLNKRVNSRKGVDLPKISDNSKTLNSRYKLKLANYVYDCVLDDEITWEMISENRYAKKITLEIFNFIDKYKDKI